MLHALFREMETNNVFFGIKCWTLVVKSQEDFLCLLCEKMWREKKGFATSITKAGENRKNINSDDLEKSYTG